MGKRFTLILTCALLFLSAMRVNAQCGSGTPVFNVNLVGNPNATWTSPWVTRNDTCCGSGPTDKCVEFIVTLDSAAVGLIFTVCGGAVPSGALYYQVGCGPPQKVGTGICLTPPGPYTITFCKPGNNSNQYCIQSLSPPKVITMDNNCSALMWAFGFADTSITWNSIYPGPTGAYNSYLSCISGCDSTYITPKIGYPPVIEYVVCGSVLSGCSDKLCDTIPVFINSAMKDSIGPVSPIACYGGTTPITANVSGGTAPYTFKWSNGDTTQTINATAGTYTVAVSDSSVCNGDTLTITVGEDSAIVLTPSVTDVKCYGQCNGSASVAATGGRPPYSYSWSPGGATTSSVSALCAASYTVTVSDSLGCSQTAGVTVSQPAVLADTLSVTNVLCNGGNTGSASVSVSGGTPGYTYLWSNGKTASKATGLTVGSYTCTISDKNGCSVTATASISQPPALTGITSKTDVLCNGGNTGTASVSVSGGTPGYTYLWSNGVSASNTTGLTAGSYTCKISDKNGCSLTVAVSISQPPALIASASETNVLCNGDNSGTASVLISGGTPGYTYLWSNGMTTSNATGLSAGSYTCNVTDKNGCNLADTFLIKQPPPIAINVTGGATTCASAVDTLVAAVTGGTPSYKYMWNPGSGTDTSMIVAPPTTTTYTLAISDKNGCKGTDSVTVTVYPLPIPNFTAPNNCLGSPTYFTNNSTGAVKWAWNFGEPTSGDSNVSDNQNPDHIYATAGSFKITLVDTSSNGCVDSVTHTVTINPVPVISFSPDTACLGVPTNFINTSTVSSGSIVSWSWNFGDPSSGPNNISTLKNPTHLFTGAGSYKVTLTATSDSGCQGNLTATVYVFPLPVALFTASNECNNSPVSFTDKSSKAVEWLWNFGDSSPKDTAENPVHTYASTGTYNVVLVVTANTGCVDTVTEPVKIQQTPAPDFTCDSVCIGNPTVFKNVSVVPAGDTTKWYWDFGDGSAIDTSQNPAHIYSSPGTYTVKLIAYSSDGCSDSITKSTAVYPNPKAQFSFSSGSSEELGTLINFLDLSTNAVIWQWNFGDSTFSTLENPSHVYSDTGTYFIKLLVESAFGCFDTAIKPITVTQVAFYMPSAFSPNSDDLNDYYYGKGIGIKDYEMFIFDRWGMLLFHCHVQGLPQSMPCRWDGKIDGGQKIVQEDTYVWMVKFEDDFGKVHKYMGRVTVIK